MRKYLINQVGSVDDIRSSLRCSFSIITVDELNRSIANERADKNRASVIKMLERARQKKITEDVRKEAHNG